MAALTLVTLPRTQFSGLEASNILQDIINLVQDSPNYNQNWDDFLSSDAGRMLVELFAYIADNLATRIDWNVNEAWISTATQRSSIVRILSLLGYNFTLPQSAAVPVTILIPAPGYSSDTYPGHFYLTPQYNQGVPLSIFSLTAKDTSGASRNFEALPYNPTTGQFDYKSGVFIGDTFNSTLHPSGAIINFYDGTTRVETYTATTDNAFTFTLNKFPVIQSSPRVYLALDNAVPPSETELTLVTSFLEAKAQNSGDTFGNAIPIPYILTVGDSNIVTISFGPTSLLPSANRRPSVGNLIRVFYRTGGGLPGNIVTNSVNTTQLLTVTPISNPGSIRNVHASFQNLTNGNGGQDAETAQHAITYAPLTLRTSQKAVTSEDYEILLGANTNVLTATSYAQGNQPTNLYTKYGVNIQPTDVWNYVVLNKTFPTNSTDYNNFYNMSLYLDPRFNEIYSFRAGSFNYPNTITTTSMLGKHKCAGDTIWWKNATTINAASNSAVFRNYFYLASPSDLMNNFVGDTRFKAKVTTVADATQQFNYLKNLAVGDTIMTITNPFTGADSSRYRIYMPTQASLTGSLDLTNGIDISIFSFIKLNIDNLGDTVIDLRRSVVTSAHSAHPWEIATSINSKLAGLGNYGPNYADSTGVLGGASVVTIGTAHYLKIQGYNQGDTYNANIIIKVPNAGLADATPRIFGLLVTGDSYLNYGYKRLTLIRNTSLSNFGNIIYENGSATLGPYDPVTLWTHYLKGDTLAIAVGTYPNYNFVQGTNVQWRPVANRVYNNVANSGDSLLRPNMKLSNFQFRFTNLPTSSPSLYSINNSWNLSYATPATITGPTLGDTITLAKGYYRIKIGVDGKGDTIISLVGDSGAYGKYPSSKMSDTINNWLRTAYGGPLHNADSYGQFTYSYYDPVYKRITLTSPVLSCMVPSLNSGQVRIDNIGWSASTTLFGVSQTVNNVYSVNGDYYLLYNTSQNLMNMIKTNKGNSLLPDANFYLHFLWDRRGNASTDEYTMQTYMTNYKITGLNNVFKKTIFQTFDIAGTIYYNQIYSSGSIKNGVESAIANLYSFIGAGNIPNRSYGQSVNRSQIENLIHSIIGVEYVTLTYFGTNLAAGVGDSTNQTNIINCDFDTILVLAENYYSGGAQSHGMDFNYVPYSG
jgi:hypothetical protein